MSVTNDGLAVDARWPHPPPLSTSLAFDTVAAVESMHQVLTCRCYNLLHLPCICALLLAASSPLCACPSPICSTPTQTTMPSAWSTIIRVYQTSTNPPPIAHHLMPPMTQMPPAGRPMFAASQPPSLLLLSPTPLPTVIFSHLNHLAHTSVSS